MLTLAEDTLKIYIAPLPTFMLEDVITQNYGLKSYYSNPEASLLSPEFDVYNSNMYAADAHFHKQLQNSVLRTHLAGLSGLEAEAGQGLYKASSLAEG